MIVEVRSVQEYLQLLTAVQVVTDGAVRTDTGWQFVLLSVSVERVLAGSVQSLPIALRKSN